MHWSLDQLRELDQHEYDELLAWAQTKGEASDPDSIDADAIVEARAAKDAKTEDSETDE